MGGLEYAHHLTKRTAQCNDIDAAQIIFEGPYDEGTMRREEAVRQ
jgi:hypothetical protein